MSELSQRLTECLNWIAQGAIVDRSGAEHQASIPVRAQWIDDIRTLRADVERLAAVKTAADEWSEERGAEDHGEVVLMKALWTFEGDRNDPCEDCDGECGEPCAPCTVVQAHAMLDAVAERYKTSKGKEKARQVENESAEQVGDKSPCDCKHRDTWRCAARKKLSTLSCHCRCHETKGDAT